LKEPDKVVDGVWRALNPGGRFVGEFGGSGNVATIVAALEEALRERSVDPGPINPWYNPTAEEYRALLAARGFVVKAIALFPRPTPLPGNIVDWLETFAQSFAGSLSGSERSAFFQRAAELCRPKLCDDGGHWHADYVRLRFAATKPQSAT
jgi:hypothetical protein